MLQKVKMDMNLIRLELVQIVAISVHIISRGGNVCATCGYMQVATTTPTTSTETTTTTSEGDPLCSHMYETGEPVYKSISEKKHIKEIIKTCMRCGRTIIAQERQEHSKYDTYESEGAKGHRKISKCSICNWKKTSGILEHTFENGMCTVEGCEYKKATSTTTKSLFSVSYASMCVGQTASCYTLTGCTDKSGVTWEITGDAVTRTDSTLLGKKAR